MRRIALAMPEVEEIDRRAGHDYRPYPLVLVRLAHVHRDALHDLLSVSYRLTVAKTRGRSKTAARRGSRGCSAKKTVTGNG